MKKFMLVFETMDDSVFNTIADLKNNLNILCRGKYDLQIEFNTPETDVVSKYSLRGAPALINLTNNKILYGNTLEREDIRGLVA